MSHLLASRKTYDLIITLSLFSAMGALLLFPQEAILAAREGLTLCANVIIPSLFPFFVLSSLTVNLGLIRHFDRLLEPVMRPLFNVGGACASALVLGFVGGYPVGARTAIALYESGSIPKKEAERLLAFSNNAGPAFILGVVGVGIFVSSRAGALLYLAHVIASVLVGILFRSWGGKASDTPPEAVGVRVSTPPFSQAFIDSVTGAVRSILSICGFVIFFTVFIRLLVLAGILPGLASLLGTVFARIGLDPGQAALLLTGLIELSSGVWGLRDAAGELHQAMAMAAFMLGWAGLSVHCQVISFMGGSGLSVRSYILGKLLHGAISAGLIFLLVRLIPFDSAVAIYLAEGVQDIAAMDFSTSLLNATLSAVILGLIAALLCLLLQKKD
ncbi:MAG: sporulation protein [Oscillospiraceae bacterium]|nr:sporulation protein [Oscillospiraceae bacterium]